MFTITYAEAGVGFLVVLLALAFAFYRGIRVQKERPQVIDSAKGKWLDAKADLIDAAGNAQAEFDRIKAEAQRELDAKIEALRRSVKDVL